MDPAALSADPPSEDASGLPGVRRIIAIGGGRGGVGKSVLAQSLAVYFAQLGKPVVLVDADPTGANVHSHFGVPAGTVAAGAHPGVSGGGDIAASLRPTTVPGLSLLPAAHDVVDAAPTLRAGRKARWLARLRSLPADY